MIVRQSTWFCVDQVGQLAIQLLLSICLYRSLGAEVFGLWVGVQALLAISTLGSVSVAPGMSLLSQGNVPRCGEVLMAASILGLLVATTLLISLLLLAGWSSDLAPAVLQHTSWMALLLGCMFGFLLLNEFCSLAAAQLRALDAYPDAALSGLASRGVAGVAIVGMAMVAPRLDALLAASLLGPALNAPVLSLALNKRGVRLSGCRHRLKIALASLWQHARWQWLKVLSASLMAQGDRLLVAHLLGPAAVALYTILLQIADPLHRLTVVVLQPTMLWAGRMRASNRSLWPYWRRFLLIEFSVFGAAVLLWLLSPWLLGLWGERDSDGMRLLLAWAIGGSCLNALNSLVNYLHVGIGQPRAMAMVSLVGAVLGLGAMCAFGTHGLVAILMCRCLFGLSLFGSWPALWRQARVG